MRLAILCVAVGLFLPCAAKAQEFVTSQRLPDSPSSTSTDNGRVKGCASTSSDKRATPASDMAFGDGITLEPMKHGTIVCLTRELVETLGAERAMADALIGELAAFTGSQFLDPLNAPAAGQNRAASSTGWHRLRRACAR